VTKTDIIVMTNSLGPVLFYTRKLATKMKSAGEGGANTRDTKRFLLFLSSAAQRVLHGFSITNCVLFSSVVDERQRLLFCTNHFSGPVRVVGPMSVYPHNN